MFGIVIRTATTHCKQNHLPLGILLQTLVPKPESSIPYYFSKYFSSTTLSGRNFSVMSNNSSTEPNDLNPDTKKESSKEKSSNKWKKRNANKGHYDTQSKRKNMRKEWDQKTKEQDIPHNGSFADEKMRERFGVTVPIIDGNDTQKSDIFTISTEIDKGDKATDINKEGNNEKKFPKRKVALLLGYIGTRYTGMQINTLQHTLHSEIELALYKAKLITHSNFGFPEKYSWSNSARTDKGVHACAQVISLKLVFLTDNLDEMRDMINEQLPDDISVLDIIRTPRSFCCRTQRNKVRYQYMLPSFVLQDRNAFKEAFDNVVDEKEIEARENKKDLLPEEINKLRENFRDYRAKESNLDQLKKALERYNGTHKFHNYTSKKKADDPSANRFIHSFTVEDPVVDKRGVEWIPCLVMGQSFLLHQIRKMMSMAIDVSRDAANMDVMEKSFTDCDMNISTAPAQGLFLDMSYYENFNRRAQAGDPLDWHSDPNAPATVRWKQFKESKVMGCVMEEEELQGNFIKYMRFQEKHIERGHYSPISKDQES